MTDRKAPGETSIYRAVCDECGYEGDWGESMMVALDAMNVHAESEGHAAQCAVEEETTEWEWDPGFTWEPKKKNDAQA